MTLIQILVTLARLFLVAVAIIYFLREQYGENEAARFRCRVIAMLYVIWACVL